MALIDNSLFSLGGKVALITGGNGGLGRAIALGFRDFGARVALTGRDTAKNESARRELGEVGAVYDLDVRDEVAVQETVARVEEHFGRLDILVNSAGDTRGGPLVSLSRADWEAVVPGWFPTEMTGFGPVTPFHDETRRRTPAQRWGEPEELVGAAVLFASRASSFINGTQLLVDGGLSVSDRLFHD